MVAPPEAPEGVSELAWASLWAEPVSRFWAPGDGVLVARLIALRERLRREGADAPLGLFAAVLALERTLYLTPTARHERLRLAASDPVAAAPAATSSSSGSGRRPSARERERLLRG